MRVDITALYCCLDDFAKLFEDWERHKLIDTGRKRNRPGKLSLSEMLLIMVLFHTSSFKNFKCFYFYGVGQQYREYFTEIPSYERFVALQSRLFPPLCLLLKMLMAQGEKTELYVIDSSSLKVCHAKRIPRNKVFEGLAKRGKTTMGWFFGFKLHITINHKGEIVAVRITPGNVDDRAVLDKMTAGLTGILLADKGYISSKWFQKLWKKGLHIMVGIRKNMKNYLLPIYNKLLMRKRFIVETVFGVLKQDMGLEHSRHRSPINAIVHLLSCLVAYCLKNHKPKMAFKKDNWAMQLTPAPTRYSILSHGALSCKYDRSYGYVHAPVTHAASISGDATPLTHRVASLLKRWWLGTHQGAISPEHLAYYLDEFTFRFNRRTSRSRGKLFYRLIEQALQINPVPAKTIIHNI